MIEPIEHKDLIGGVLRYQHLENLPFIHGKQDCYSIPVNMLWDNLGIKLTNYARPDNWWIEGFDLYNQNFRNEGFEIVDGATENLKLLRPLDCMLVAIPDPRNPDASHVPNHCAVYLGSGHIIHHRLGKNSQVIPYRASMKEWTTAIIRHKDVPDLSIIKTKEVNILDHLLPHKRELVLGATHERKDQNS